MHVRVEKRNMPKKIAYRRKKTFVKKPSYKKRDPSSTWASRNVPTWVPSPTKEHKVLNVDSASAALPLASAFSSPGIFGLIPGGNQNFQRIGTVITFKRIVIRVTYLPGTLLATETPNSQVRFMVIYDKNPNGNAPVLSEIFPTATPTFTSNVSINRFPERYITVFDYVSRPSSGESDTSDRMNPVSFKLEKKVNLQQVYYTNTANSISDLASGAFWVLVAGNGPNTTTASSINFSYQMQYTDV